MSKLNPTSAAISIPTIMQLNSIKPKRDGLIHLLHDCVESDASIGFIAPLEKNEAEQYWQDVETDLTSGHRLLLVAPDGENIAGSVQLSLCKKKNGLHRAEVEKLIVHTAYRQRGIGRMLMDELERLAKQYQRSLLVLDTRTDDPASALYRKCGFIEAGQIPNFAMNSNGEFSGTTYFYKLI
ncbi:GNAT family N-acetyltransferase [Xenorhabdus sp. DI]|uniref:GNAT family N-acetyltransferase n=1 Tax=Xenorhabdus doucetiae TaxID=351671 RepID=UPI0019A92243|nr:MULTISPECIES: N-acetyltransferase [unclassified Xenorhabdus]MBD2785740.1 GNAT family N-acetyltransferase [Xenorhabdus sp. 3]MBD2788094.1 GNAT family N-acetyltransferase [Xenorhabdus sp. DI]